MSKASRERWVNGGGNGQRQLRPEEMAPGPRQLSVDKIQKYGWKPAGPKGQLVWLDKGLLEVDSEYQRDLRPTHANDIAREFSWPVFGAIVVARRNVDGQVRYFIVIGQHRHAAAMSRSDIDELPCIVFDFGDRKEEADAFAKEARNKRLPNSNERHKVDVFRGDEVATWVDRIIQDAGYRVGSGNGRLVVRCVQTLNAWARKNRSALAALWPVIARAAAADECAVANHVIDAVMYVESNLSDGQTLQEAHWLGRIETLGYKALDRAARRAVAAQGKGGEKVYASGVLEELNRGQRGRFRLQLKPR